MKLTASEVAKIVSGELVGDKDIVLTGVNSLSDAKENEISFLGNSKYFSEILKTVAGVIFVAVDADISKFKNKNIIRVTNPVHAYSIILSMLEKENLGLLERSIHESASIAKSAKVGRDSYIGQNVVVEANAELGDYARIFPNVYIGKKVKIGSYCLIYPNVVIRENTIIGDRVIINPGVVIGGDGFGFVTIGGKIKKIPQIGIVEIGNDVEIGSNTTIDRATVGTTKIGNGTKIDNLVQIAHNVRIGDNCIIVAQVGIAGSTHLGSNVAIGGQTGLAGHLKIGNDVMIASQSGVSGDIKDGQQVGGNPIALLRRSIKIRALIRKLPEMYQDLKKVKEKLANKRN
jgi:UDP-3-O-[3-hydroxymyristoyl] glucosamine N-acyltransferase